MTDKPISILVCIKRMGKGFFASSEDLRGLLLFHLELGTVLAEIPKVITALYQAQGVNVEVQEEVSEDAINVFPLRYSATKKAA